MARRLVISTVDELRDLEASIEAAALQDRFVLLGLSAAVRLLVVVHCFRDTDDVIRLISARKATSSESVLYEAELRP